MFNNKANNNEVNTESCNCKNDEGHHCLKEMRNLAVNDLCPIIFNDEKNLETSNQHPELILASSNLEAMKYDLSMFPYSYLSSLHRTSVDMFIETLINRIKEESLLSILTTMDLLDNTTDSFYLKYFNIRETIEQKMRAHNIIDKVFVKFTNARPYSMNDLSQTAFDNTRNLCDLYANFIFNAIMSVVIDAINCAVDDIIMRVHIIPNIMELKRDIIKLYNPPKEDVDNERFWLYADCTIKNTIVSTIRYYSAQSILENIINIFATAHETSYFIYDDTMEEKSKNDFMQNDDDITTVNF